MFPTLAVGDGEMQEVFLWSFSLGNRLVPTDVSSAGEQANASMGPGKGKASGAVRGNQDRARNASPKLPATPTVTS